MTAEPLPVERLPYFEMGPCLICGCPGMDQGHRVRDALMERYHAGDSLESLADDYGVSTLVAAALIAIAEKENADAS